MLKQEKFLKASLWKERLNLFPLLTQFLGQNKTYLFKKVSRRPAALNSFAGSLFFQGTKRALRLAMTCFNSKSILGLLLISCLFVSVASAEEDESKKCKFEFDQLNLARLSSKEKLAPKKIRPISFFIYTPGLSGAELGEATVRAQFQEFLNHLGNQSEHGTVGVALSYPYTAFVTGTGPENFRIRTDIMHLYELNVRVAKQMGLPVLVGFNGGPWASTEGTFNSYWKTTQGGRFLARYQDGQVNESIRNTGSLTESEILPFLQTGPYNSQRQQDTLFLTLSPDAQEYRQSRLQVLGLALQEWKRLDRIYPGTIQAFTTDSEVSNFSFRSNPSGDILPIGYEEDMTKPFCRQYGISDCAAFFRGRRFSYRDPDERHWYEFRVEAHRQFVSDTVSTIRKYFPSTTIFTHQLGVLDGKILADHRRHDFASPQETAFVEGAFPGVTAYVHGKRDGDFRSLVSQISAKAPDGWALPEFNPGKNWSRSKMELTDYSYSLLQYLAEHQVSMIALLAWKSNTLDTGIKASGVDDAVKRYLLQGP
jgi:hypothetical protein